MCVSALRALFSILTVLSTLSLGSAGMKNTRRSEKEKRTHVHNFMCLCNADGNYAKLAFFLSFSLFDENYIVPLM